MCATKKLPFCPGVALLSGRVQLGPADYIYPRNRSWTRPRVRLIGCLPRSNDAAGRARAIAQRIKANPASSALDARLTFRFEPSHPTDC